MRAHEELAAVTSSLEGTRIQQAGNAEPLINQGSAGEPRNVQIVVHVENAENVERVENLDGVENVENVESVGSGVAEVCNMEQPGSAEQYATRDAHEQPAEMQGDSTLKESEAQREENSEPIEGKGQGAIQSGSPEALGESNGARESESGQVTTNEVQKQEPMQASEPSLQ